MRLALPVLGLYLVLATAGCAGSSAELTQAPLPTAIPSPTPGGTATPLPSQLYVILDEQPLPIENGEQVALTKDLNLGITVDPYPPRGLSAHAVVDLHLTRADGQPVEGAEITVRYDMFTMVHGPFEPEIIARDDGHYLLPLEMIMYGAWELNTTVRPPGELGSHELTIAVILVAP